MSEDEPFLRALLAAPDDPFTRLVYADWLDDRGDPRAEYLRLRARLAETRPGTEERAALDQRQGALQAALPSWWLAIVGFRARPHGPDPARVDEAARALGRPVQRTAHDYAVTLEAAAVSGLTGAVAFLESWSKWNGTHHDITYYFRLRDPAGREASCEPHTYNPYFGCRVQFLEWYGDVALMIYEEKHCTYACRFGFTGAPLYRTVEYDWVISGRELGFCRWRESDVRRLSVPELDEPPSLSKTEASERELLPEES